MSISAHAASAREQARRTDGRFGEQGHADPGGGIIDARDEALAQVDLVNRLAPPWRLDRDATLEMHGGRIVRLTGRPGHAVARLYAPDGSPLGAVPTAEVWTLGDGEALVLSGTVPPPPPDAGPDTSAYDRWEGQWGAQFDAAYLEPTQAARVRDFVHAHAPGGDGLTHRLDAATARSLTDYELDQVGADLQAPYDDSLSVAEAIAIHGTQAPDWAPGRLVFPADGFRRVEVTEPTWRLAGGTPPVRAEDVFDIDAGEQPPF